MRGFAVLLAFVACATCATLTINAIYPESNVPKGASFTLRGSADGLSWYSDTDMTKTATNTWSATITVTLGTMLEFKTLLGGVWQIGSNEYTTPTSNGQAVNSYPFYFTTQGTYTHYNNIYSPQLNNTRGLDIYTPPSYTENTLKTYTNVLIMQDGQNLFNPKTSFAGVAWMCQDTVDRLVNEGAMDEIIILGAWNTGANRINEYTYSYDAASSIQAGGEGDLYLDFLDQTLLPQVRAMGIRIPQTDDPSQIGILGSSLGGLISCYAGWTRPQTYGRAGCMSTSFWWNNQDFTGTILTQNPVPSPEPIFYLDSGNAGPSDDDEAQTITVRNHMESLGLSYNSTLFYHMQPGGQHSEYYWGERFWVPMTDMYPPAPLPLQ